MQPSWKFYLGGIILTLHDICNYMPTFEGTPRPTDSKISFISKSSYQIICKWCQRNYRSHLRPQGKTPFLQYRAMALPLPKCCQRDTQPRTQPEPMRGHTQRRRHPQGPAALHNRQSREAGEEAKSKMGRWKNWRGTAHKGDWGLIHRSSRPHQAHAQLDLTQTNACAPWLPQIHSCPTAGGREGSPRS